MPFYELVYENQKAIWTKENGISFCSASNQKINYYFNNLKLVLLTCSEFVPIITSKSPGSATHFRS